MLHSVWEHSAKQSIFSLKSSEGQGLCRFAGTLTVQVPFPSAQVRAACSTGDPSQPDPVCSGFGLNTRGLSSLDRGTAENMIQKQPCEGKGDQLLTVFQYKNKGESHEKSRRRFKNSRRRFKNNPRKVALHLHCACITEQQVRGNHRCHKLTKGNKAVEGY